MKQTRKLGRGLEDFSHLFLSSPEEDAIAVSRRNENEIPAEHAGSIRPHIVCIAGERGVQEKAFLIAHLAFAISREGKRVVVFDADFGLPRLCMLMRDVPSSSLLQLVTEQRQGTSGLGEHNRVMLITVDADLSTSAALSSDDRLLFRDACRRGMHGAEVVLVMLSGDYLNHAAGFIRSADDVVVVTPRPVADMINAYGLIKKIVRIDDQIRLGVVTSKNALVDQADAVFKKMQRIVKQFLNRSLINHGYLTEDVAIDLFLKQEKPAGQTSPSCETSQCIAAISRSLLAGGIRAQTERSRDATDMLFAMPLA